MSRPLGSPLAPRVATILVAAALAGVLAASAGAPAVADTARARPDATPAPGAPSPAAERDALERGAAAAARRADWPEVLRLLTRLHDVDPVRYADGRFDYLAARALSGLGRDEEALPRFERFVATGDLFDVPARLSAARLRFRRGEGGTALDLLLPLLQRREGAVARRAIRIALDALETAPDDEALARLVAARPSTPPRERRRLAALRAEALERERKPEEAAAIRRALLSEARRDDAAAVVMARELRGKSPQELPDSLLGLLVETARSQRDLELAEKLATERERRAARAGDRVVLAGARFDLYRLKASRGKFAEAAEGFSAILRDNPRPVRASRSPKDDAPGTAAFRERVRFNLGAMLEKLGDLDGAVYQFRLVEAARTGTAGLAVLQRARLEIRRGDLAAAERLLAAPALARVPGRIEGLLLLVERAARKGDAARAARALAPVEALARARRLPQPWRAELPFWRAVVAQAAGRPAEALEQLAAVLSEAPYAPVAELSRARIASLDPALPAAFVRKRRALGERLLAEGKDVEAKDALLPAALLGDPDASAFLKVAYSRLPRYADVLLAPELPDQSLPDLCGDAAACRLLQLGLPEDAEPIVRDARRLDTLLGCVVSARLAEDADAGPAALEAAEALERKVPPDFLLELAPRAVVRALCPRPFDRLVAATASELGVPRGLLYAVMRQESRFDREAASPAAARGLMQLTLPAAGEAARELNESPPAYADLYDPARSIRLGARTLRSLLDRFAGDEASATSAYNAGAGQTALWSGGSAVPAEALLAAISYGETRVYFRRVLTNRRLYSLSLGAEPAPAPPAAAGPRR